MDTNLCFKCGNSCKTLKCGRCKLTSYCSKGCQTTDWPTHKEECIPVEKRLMNRRTAYDEFIASCKHSEEDGGDEKYLVILAILYQPDAKTRDGIMATVNKYLKIALVDDKMPVFVSCGDSLGKALYSTDFHLSDVDYVYLGESDEKTDMALLGHISEWTVGKGDGLFFDIRHHSFKSKPYYQYPEEMEHTPTRSWNEVKDDAHDIGEDAVLILYVSDKDFSSDQSIERKIMDAIEETHMSADNCKPCMGCGLSINDALYRFRATHDDITVVCLDKAYDGFTVELRKLEGWGRVDTADMIIATPPSLPIER